MAERQIPGGQYINETDTAQRQIPGGQYINETTSTGGAVPTLSAATVSNITTTGARLSLTLA